MNDIFTSPTPFHMDQMEYSGLIEVFPLIVIWPGVEAPAELQDRQVKL